MDRDAQALASDLEASAVDGLPEGTKPSELEQAVGRAKIIPGTDKYQRYGVLIGLAECGVLPGPALPPMWDRFIPNAERHAAARTVRGAPRSDITLPLAGWRGGLDEQRARRLTDV